MLVGVIASIVVFVESLNSVQEREATRASQRKNASKYWVILIKANKTCSKDCTTGMRPKIATNE